jgi:hypothetical protein
MKIIKNQILTLGLIVAMLGIPAMANATKGIPIGDGWAPSLFFGILLVIALWPFWLILSVALLVAYLLYKTYVIDDLKKQKRGAASSCEIRELDIPEGYTFSIREAAHAIGVTRGTLQGYIKAGRLHTNSDESLDAAALLRAGFIIRTFPPRRG